MNISPLLADSIPCGWWKKLSPHSLNISPLVRLMTITTLSSTVSFRSGNANRLPRCKTRRLSSTSSTTADPCSGRLGTDSCGNDGSNSNDLCAKIEFNEKITTTTNWTVSTAVFVILCPCCWVLQIRIVNRSHKCSIECCLFLDTLSCSAFNITLVTCVKVNCYQTCFSVSKMVSSILLIP